MKADALLLDELPAVVLPDRCRGTIVQRVDETDGVGLADQLPDVSLGSPAKGLGLVAHAQLAVRGSRCVHALQQPRELQELDRAAAGGRWQEHELVFASTVGTPLDPSNVRRGFRYAIRGAPGLDPANWTPRELRHSFVSLLSDNGTPIDEIARLVGHSSAAVTELVYRQQIRRCSSRAPSSWTASSGVRPMRSYSWPRFSRVVCEVVPGELGVRGRDARIRTGGLLLPKQAR
jgi:hypothetical protein